MVFNTNEQPDVRTFNRDRRQLSTQSLLSKLPTVDKSAAIIFSSTRLLQSSDDIQSRLVQGPSGILDPCVCVFKLAV